jgi:hypothetical protein
MRINCHKSELIPMNLSEEQSQVPHQIFRDSSTFDKLKREDLQPLVDKIMKKIASWRGKLLSSAARMTLVKACLARIPVYLLSFLKFPKWAIKLLNYHLANCLWNDSRDKHRYHLANWESVSMHKDFGGLGVPNLRDLNICLVGSWIKRYQADGGKLWKEVIDFKYRTK